MIQEIKYDLYRLTGKEFSYRDFVIFFLRSKFFRHMYFYRKMQVNRNILTRIGFCLAYKKSGVELPWQAQIGAGFLCIHSKGITINAQTKAGRNLTMLKGATIGSIKGGRREGVPIIGDNVYIGLNSTVVGGIKIGNDVLIAPNSFVNFDVPDHSVVIGNPGIIHYKQDASKMYLSNPIIFSELEDEE